MLGLLYPSFSGTHKPRSLSPDLIARLAQRIRSPGLFPLASKRRNQYEIADQSKDSLRFRSTNLLTGINVGLNDVNVHIDWTNGEIRYSVTFWTWAKYCISLGLVLGVVLAFFLVTPLFGRYIFPASYYPSDTAIKVVVIPMIVFWGLIWPWLLIPLHKRPAARCLVRTLDEVNEPDRKQET